jgi:hypothetical protein
MARVRAGSLQDRLHSDSLDCEQHRQRFDDRRDEGLQLPLETAHWPPALWLIGLGNLGQAYAWLLGCLPYAVDAASLMVLQDFDCISSSNESTSLLSHPYNVGRKKTRAVAEWLEARGFNTIIEERRFGPSIQRNRDEPGAALCGVDNALARLSLEKAGFGLIVEAGLGAGAQGFRKLSVHTFPATRSAEETWSKRTAAPDVRDMPAYQALRRSGMDQCGLIQLASRTIAVPFVGLTAACLVVAELLRRLNGGRAIEVASVDLLAPNDAEVVATHAPTYPFGHTAAKAESNVTESRAAISWRYPKPGLPPRVTCATSGCGKSVLPQPN